MSIKNEPAREQARQILKKGILDMNIARLIQMSEFGLIGNISLSRECVVANNAFNRIEYDEGHNIITFLIGESQAGNYGEISFSIDLIAEISGCEDAENPDEYLNINIKLEDGTAIVIKVLY